MTKTVTNRELDNPVKLVKKRPAPKPSEIKKYKESKKKK